MSTLINKPKEYVDMCAEYIERRKKDMEFRYRESTVTPEPPKQEGLFVWYTVDGKPFARGTVEGIMNSLTREEKQRLYLLLHAEGCRVYK